MNIFVLDNNPVIAAQQNCDQHCTKIVLEVAQMLACAFPLERLQQKDVPRTKAGSPRKHSYFNHPVSKWVRESRANFEWAIIHAVALDCERRVRNFERNTSAHFSMDFILWALNHIDEINFDKVGLTPFAVAISEFNQSKKVYNKSYPLIKKYKLDAVAAYKLYYKLDKPFATWKRNRPEWMDYSVDELLQDKK